MAPRGAIFSSTQHDGRSVARSGPGALAVDFKQACAALATADAHSNDAPLGLAPTTLLQDVAGEPRAGHAEGMTDRDRAAIDVVLLGIDAELVARIETLAGEGLVEFPEIDIVDL